MTNTNVNLEKYRADYWSSLDASKPFSVERPALFGPAAAAQESQSRPFMMWKFISEWIPWQYTNFIDESMSYHETAYLGDWSALPKLRVKGPDAQKFLSRFTVNNLGSFNPGQIKHAIQTNEEGKVAGEGVLFKADEEEFRYSGGAVYWLDYWFNRDQWNATADVYTPDEFVFVIQGPQSLNIIEHATQEKFRGLKFSYQRMSSIASYPVRVLRTGITGELGYEVHGPSDIANDVWLALFEAGKEFGVRLLGGRSQVISHIEGCFPTIGRDFLPAVSAATGKSKAHTIDLAGGSYEWSDVKELMRSPFELNWDREVSLETHEFMGRDALIAEKKAGGPARRLVGLNWNSDDVVSLYATLFKDGPRPLPMELPRVTHKHAMAPDAVIVNGATVGCSTSRVYSSFLRRMISLCVMDSSFREPGTQVEVIWGDRGGPQMPMRATVTSLPFKEDKRRIDVTNL